MILTAHGDGCVRLQSGDTSVLVDSSSNRLKGDVLVYTTRPNENLAEESLSAITFAGEYEIEGIRLGGWGLSESSTEEETHTMYRILWESEDLVFGLLNSASVAPQAGLLDHVSDADVLFLGVGKDRLATKAAIKMAKQLEPALLIPLFSTEKDKKEFVGALDRDVEEVEKYTFHKKDLRPESLTTVILKDQ